MSVDCVGGAESCSEDFGNWDDEEVKSVLWNGRVVNVIDPEQLEHIHLKALEIIQSLGQLLDKNQEIRDFPYTVTLDVMIEDEEVDDYWPENDHQFEFAPTAPLEFTLEDRELIAPKILLCKSFWKKSWDKIRKTAKKTGHVVKRVVEEIVDGTKKVAEAIGHVNKKATEKTIDFIKDHKKETLIVTAVIAAVVGAYFISAGAISGAAAEGAAALGSAAAAASGGGPRKRKEDGSDETPNSDPLSLDKDIINATKPSDFSKESLEASKQQAHRALDLTHELKRQAEIEYAPLKAIQPDFNPSAEAIKTVLNVLFEDPNNKVKEFVTSENWNDFIKTGHDKIDQAFAAEAAKFRAPPPPKTVSFLEKIPLSLEIIKHSMMEPTRIDPNCTLEHFIKNELPPEIIPPKLDTSQTLTTFFASVGETLADGIEDILKGIKEYGPKNPFNFERISKGYPIIIGPRPIEVSKYYEIEGISQDDMMITFINGMDNTLIEDAKGNGQYLWSLNPGQRKIEAVYNHTNGKFLDVVEIHALNSRGFSPLTESMLVKKWTDFHDKNKDKPQAKILHFCHSQGALHTKNALTILPKEIRDRVIVVAIAPAAVISNQICFRSFNYASKNDVVPQGEILEAICNSDVIEITKILANLPSLQPELTRLEPHKDAKGFDHTFKSPTFIERIIDHFEDYEIHKGEYQ